MNIAPQPSPAFINSDPQLTDAFWYWSGASGRRYIHSVYPPDLCPVMPGAVYISVREDADRRFVPVAIDIADAVGQLTGTFNAAAGATEVHVHLLAQGGDETLRIRDDLRAELLEDAIAEDRLPDMSPAAMQYELHSASEAADLICAG